MTFRASFNLFFFFNDTATTEIYTLSLHDALPICLLGGAPPPTAGLLDGCWAPTAARDRKSTRLNSSHSQISYAVFCLKKKKKRGTIAVHGSTWSSGTGSPAGNISRRSRKGGCSAS